MSSYGNHLFKSVRPCQWDLLLCRLLSLEDKGACGATQRKDSWDVRFPQKGESQVYTVVQPDLCVVCDFEKIDSKGCVGAPDLVVEILSPGNSKKEMKSKFALYQEEGVREYWIVDPERELVFVYVADNKKFKPTIPIADDYVYSTIFPDFKIHTSDLFHIKN